MSDQKTITKTKTLGDLFRSTTPCNEAKVLARAISDAIGADNDPNFEIHRGSPERAVILNMLGEFVYQANAIRISLLELDQEEQVANDPF